VIMFILGDIVQYKMRASETEFKHPYYQYKWDYSDSDLNRLNWLI
jgi:hypothetical protein